MFHKEKFTKENFEALLLCLSTNRDEAGKVYEQIRKQIHLYFYLRGCADCEGLTDETFNRVVVKIDTLDLSQGNKLITIFYGFANNVFLESLKAEKKEIPLEEAGNLKFENGNSDIRYEFLENCLKNLKPTDKELILEYYQGEKSGKFEIRKNLAAKFKLTMGAMHIKLHRLRQDLKKCLEKQIKNNL